MLLYLGTGRSQKQVTFNLSTMRLISSHSARVIPLQSSKVISSMRLTSSKGFGPFPMRAAMQLIRSLPVISHSRRTTFERVGSMLSSEDILSITSARFGPESASVSIEGSPVSNGIICVAVYSVEFGVPRQLQIIYLADCSLQEIIPIFF